MITEQQILDLHKVSHSDVPHLYGNDQVAALTEHIHELTHHASKTWEFLVETMGLEVPGTERTVLQLLTMIDPMILAKFSVLVNHMPLPERATATPTQGEST